MHKYLKLDIVIVICQVILCAIAFQYHLSHHLDATFSNEYDGFKNNYTLHQYVQEPIGAQGLFHFEFMHYPYGDVVFTSDNTPLISIPLRYIHHHIYPIAEHTQSIYTFIMLLNIIGVSLVFRRLFVALFTQWPAWILILASVGFPWLSDQILRLPRGHFNLSLSFFVVYAIYLCVRYHRVQDKLKSRWLILSGMVLFTYLGFLAHGYYLAVLGTFIGLFLGIYTLVEIIRSKKVNARLCEPVFYLFGILLLSYGTMLLSDPYLDMRQSFAHGIDSAEQKLTLPNLYTTYVFNTIQFPLHVGVNFPFSESQLYLSHVFWLAVLFITVGLLSSASMRYQFVHLHTQAWRQPLWKVFFIVGVFIFFSSLGFKINTHKTSFEIVIFFKHDSSVMILYSYLLVTLIVVAITLIIFTKYKMTATSSSFKKWSFVITVVILALLIMLLFVLRIKGLNLPNVLSPYKWMSMLTRKVEQFRSIGRVFWTGYWLLVMWAVIVTYILFKERRRSVQIVVSLALVLGLGIEVRDRVAFIKDRGSQANLFNRDVLNTLPEIKDVSSFQTILPIPFFEVGSEDYNVTINDYDAFSRVVMLLSYKYNLPMMAAKLSRTPVPYAYQTMALINEQKIPNEMMSHLQPEGDILIMVYKPALENPDFIKSLVSEEHAQDVCYQANLNQLHFLERPDVQYLYEQDNVVFYRWSWKS